MSNPTNKLVTQARIRALLECYGSASAAWPEEERRAALNLLSGYHELQALRNRIQSLDDILSDYRELEKTSLDARRVQSLQQRIMDQLPAQEMPEHHASHNTGSTFRSRRIGFWTGSIAASALIAILSVTVIKQTHGPDSYPAPQQDTNLADNTFSQWAWEDITGESLVPETEAETDPRTLLALLDLEFPAE